MQQNNPHNELPHVLRGSVRHDPRLLKTDAELHSQKSAMQDHGPYAVRCQHMKPARLTMIRTFWEMSRVALQNQRAQAGWPSRPSIRPARFFAREISPFAF